MEISGRIGNQSIDQSISFILLNATASRRNSRNLAKLIAMLYGTCEHVTSSPYVLVGGG